MSASPVLQVSPLGFPWETIDPFLFCVYHDDAYPKGNGAFGPAASLDGRNIGNDFAGKDGWRMYHGQTVPGFPAHPHRGFETVTIVRKGLIDHSDSLGATARFGGGDVQWLTAGRGIVHSEMFPLLDEGRGNPLELFQIWLNLPARNKMAAPHFTMFWSEEIPHLQAEGVEVVNIAGRLANSGEPLAPPPDSWASKDEADLAIWTLKLAPGARWTLPAATGEGTRRKLYFFKGADATLAGQRVAAQSAIELDAGREVEVVNGDQTAEFLMLQARPLAEPVAQYGPFVMNTREEIQQAFADYQRTQFGGWPYPDTAPVHGVQPERFARHADGRQDTRDAIAEA
jgi:redox-sensitive bicupin YhaK (pirin superfamily)